MTPITIVAIGLGVLSTVLAGVAIWALLNFNEQKTSVDEKKQAAVAVAKKEQLVEDEKKFSEREKEPRRQFDGPADYGGVSFLYPKNWSVYVGSDVSKGGDYQAYLNPGVVMLPSPNEQYALRILIENNDYDAVVDSYQSLIDKGSLNAEVANANGLVGTRLDGTFSKNIRGAAVIFEIRDKTLTLMTDADTFKPEFEKIVKSLEFNL